MKSLDDIRGALEGLIPTAIATVAADGTPNVTYLSHVEYVDRDHVALSCQFFNKTRKNVDENPYACLFMHHAATTEAYRVRVRFDHAETEGPLYERMAARIQAIASHTGMAGIFRLLSSDVYQVESIEAIDGFLLPGGDGPLPPQPVSELAALQQVSERVARADCLETLMSQVLEILDRAFGMTHTMLLVPDESGRRLYTLASRGYGESGVGSEVSFGEGLIGAVAARRVSLRVSAVEGDLRYGRAIRGRATQAGETRLGREVPLPGLPDAQSQLALPLLLRDQLVGVLAAESRAPLSFDEWHEAILRIVGNQVASGMAALQREGEEDAPREVKRAPSGSGRVRRFHFYRADDCVFVDDEYLVRNVPGLILWKILRTHASTGRTEFCNRELRLDDSLGLPPIKDNLESRLILLRKRLEERCPEVRLEKTGRGRFALDLGCAIELSQE